MGSQEVIWVSNSWISTVTTCFFITPLPQEQGQCKMTLTSGGVKGLIYETRSLPWDLVPGIPADSHLPPAQGHHHMNVNQVLPALSGLSGAKTHFPFSSSFNFSWVKLPCCCPLSHWQQHDISLKGTGTYRLYIALPPGESGLENNALAPQIIAYIAHWPRSEKFDSNTNRWRWKIFCWAFVLSIGFSMDFKLTWALVTGITCSCNWQVWPVALIVSYHILVAGSGSSARDSRIIFRREIRSTGCSFIFQGEGGK